MSRGRGKGRGVSGFNREQLDYMGVGNLQDQLPRPVTQPQPLYPLLESKPIPLNVSKEATYMLILKQDFLEHMQYKSTYVNLPTQQKEPELEIDKLLAQLPKMQETCKFDWRLLPKELRSKLVAKRTKNQQLKQSKDDIVDIQSRLQHLESIEKRNVTERPIKPENVEPEEEEEIEDEEQDEEMDEGTDYVNNYFDNGEAYEDEEDNLDDGPIY